MPVGAEPPSSAGAGGPSEILGQLSFWGWTNAFTDGSRVCVGSPSPVSGRGYEFVTQAYTNTSTPFSKLTETGDHGLTFPDFGTNSEYQSISCEPGLYSFYFEHRGTSAIGSSTVETGGGLPYLDFHSDPGYAWDFYTYPSIDKANNWQLSTTVLMQIGTGDVSCGIDWELYPPSGGWPWTIIQFVAVRHY